LLGCLVRFFKVAFVLASWRRRDVLHGIQRQSQSPPPFSTALGLLFAWVCCVVSQSGETPEPLFSFAPGIAGALCKFRLCVLFVSVCNSQTCLHSV
jgi:hypothetical protein